MEDDSELFNENVDSRSVLTSSNSSIAEKDVVEQCNMDVTTNDNPKRPIKRRVREENDTEWTLIQNKEKKIKESSVEVYISSKEKLPRQFALARLFKNKGIKDISKVKYINNYKVRIDCTNELSAINLETCKDLIDMDWRFSRPDIKTYSYGVIKDVDLDLAEDDLKSCITCPENFELVSLQRLKRRNMNESSEDLWIMSEAVRLCFKGNLLPAYIYADGLRIKVEPFVFPVSQCSRCWKFGHTVRVCPSKNTLCPKCGSNHPNCDTQRLKCLNCSGQHMALSKICPAYLKEKRLKELMAEFNCTYRKALSLYVVPSPHRDQTEPISVTNMPNLFPPLHNNIEPTERSSSPTFAEVVKTKAIVHSPPTPKEQKSAKTHGKTRVAIEDDWTHWLPTEEEMEDLKESSNREDPEVSQKREVHFKELLARLKEIVFLKRRTVGERIKMAIQCCVEWLILVVVDNVSDWSTMKKLFELFNG